VSKGDGPESLENSLLTSFLQAQTHSEEPAHRGVQAVVSAKDDHSARGRSWRTKQAGTFTGLELGYGLGQSLLE